MSLFLDDYVAFTASITDAPLEFAESGGLCALATIAARYRWMENGLQPNLFVINAGPSTRDHKSTTVDNATSFLKDIVPERVGPTDFTPEALIMYMSKKYGDDGGTYNNLYLGVEEFGTILSMMQRSFGAGMAASLCNLYDGKDIIRVRATSKPIKVDKPILTVLGGCAYRMLDLYTTAEDWGSGFFARQAFVVGTPRPKFAVKPTPDPAKRAVVMGHLYTLHATLKATPGAMKFTPLALQEFKDAMAQEPFRTLGNDLDLAGHRERLMTTIQKFALLYQVDEDPCADIGHVAMGRAIDFGRIVWQSGGTVWSICAKDRDRRLFKKIVDTIMRAGGILSRRDLLRRSHLRVIDFEEVLKTLVMGGVVELRDGQYSVVYANFDED